MKKLKDYILKPIYFVFFFCVLLNAQKNDIEIIQKPIDYSKERVKLSLDYLKDHYNIVQTQPTITPKMIVLHYTAGGTLESNFKYFNNSTIENGRGYNKKESPLNVSAHFLVDRDGKIYQLIDTNLFARHTIGLNYCAIGIENIGSKSQPLTDKQVEANAKLVRYLAKKYKIEYLIGHQEYGIFKKSNLWKETNASYFTGKEDPGKDFMMKVRKQVADLHLKEKP